MNIALWVATVVLAVTMVIAGSARAFLRPGVLESAGLGWADPLPDRMPRAAGFQEILGAVGLTVPAITGTAPVLVPLSAAFIALLMLGSVLVHLRMSASLGRAAPAIALALLAIFVAWGRFGPYAL